MKKLFLKKTILVTGFPLSISMIAALLLFSGCTHYYYAPNMQNLPLFQQKGETRISPAISSGDGWTGFELQASHAFTNHAGATFNFATAGGSEDDFGSGHGTMMEGGAGYFYPAGKHFVFETFGHVGYGSIKNLYTAGSSPYSKVGFIKLSVQPAIGFRNSIVECILSVRMAGLNYLSEKHSSALNIYDQGDLDYIENHSSSLLAEPAFTLRLGWNYVKLQGQICGSVNLTAPQLQQAGANVSLGLVFTIPPPKENSAQR
jgi:hypothetical protein